MSVHPMDSYNLVVLSFLDPNPVTTSRLGCVVKVTNVLSRYFRTRKFSDKEIQRLYTYLVIDRMSHLHPSSTKFLPSLYTDYTVYSTPDFEGEPTRYFLSDH